MMKIESIEHARFRALAQITVDQEKGVEAFEEYMKLAFPYLEATQQKDKQKFIDLLNEEARRGPMIVRALEQPRTQSRLKKRYVRADKPYDTAKQSKLYDKLGNALPL